MLTFYAIKPDPISGSTNNVSAFSHFKEGMETIRQSIDLLRLIDPQQARELELLELRVVREASDAAIRFNARDLQTISSLLHGIEERLVAAGIVDKDWRVPAEELEELARQVPAMDLTTERSVWAKRSALGEIMINVGSLRIFVEEALSEGAVIVAG